MPALCITARFPASMYHGRADGGEPEWPPSPLRLFQSHVVAATSGGACAPAADADSALRWLERRLPPTIVATDGRRGAGYRLSVPNNAMDIVARFWSRGVESSADDAKPATHRTMKTVRPMHLDEEAPVHFLWTLEGEAPAEARTLAALARRIVALGWGIDLAICDGAVLDDDQTAALEGQRWTPRRSDSEKGLRVPVAGTLDDVISRHRGFLARLSGNRFEAPPPLGEFAKIRYLSAVAHIGAPFAVFALSEPERRGIRSFDTASRALTLAAMMRHATGSAASRSGWTEARINEVVLGHGERRGGTHVPVASGRFAYVPLPSIEPRATGEVVADIRRIMVTMWSGSAHQDIAWASRALIGQPLVSERDGQPRALLSRLQPDDAVSRRYLRASSTWATVTPIVLPGFDDPAHLRRRLRRGVDVADRELLFAKLDDRTDRLVRKAIVHAGFSSELAEHAEIEWSRIGFLAGTQPADRYGVPNHLKRFTRLHVRIAWRDRHGRAVDVAGPCILGGGRFYGLGLLAV